MMVLYSHYCEDYNHASNMVWVHTAGRCIVVCVGVCVCLSMWVPSHEIINIFRDSDTLSKSKRDKSPFKK